MLEAELPRRQSQDSASVFSATKSNAAYNTIANKRLAEFMSRDSDLWIFQRFDRLNLFYIVYLQQHLAHLEQRLDQAVPDAVDGFNKKEFELLMPEIESSLKKYDDALVAQARHKAYVKPQLQPVKLIEQHCRNQGLDLDYDLVLGSPDETSKHVSIAAGEKGWIHRLVDAYPLLRERFATPATRDNATSSILIYSEAKVRRMEQMLISIGFCILLVCPIFALSYLQSKALKLIIVLIFILVLSTLTIDLAASTSKTSVALVAGYSAILVVFLTSGTNP